MRGAGGETIHFRRPGHTDFPLSFIRIENALPGRDSFDIEIYGMVGIPEADLAEWQARKAANGGGGGSGPSQPKRQKIENVVLTPAQLKAQLEAHKALMSGQAPAPGTVAPTYSAPPPASYYSGPPPGFPPPQQSQMQHPPPAAAAPSPHRLAVQNKQKSRIVYTDTALSPEEKLAGSSKYLYFDPDEPRLVGGYGQMPPQQPPPQPPYQQQGYYAGPPPPVGWPPAANGSPYPANGSPYPANAPAYPSHPAPAATASPYAPPATASPYPPPPSASSFYPPPTSTESPYAPPPAAASFSPPPPTAGPPSHSAYPQAAPPMAPAPPAPPASSSPHPAQSYPAYPPGASPPASRPHDNTAEALSVANSDVALQQREQETEQMVKGAENEVGKDGEGVVGALDDASKAAPPTTTGKRARAADLF